MVPRFGLAQAESMHLLDVQRAIDATLPLLRDRIPETTDLEAFCGAAQRPSVIDDAAGQT